MFTTKSPSVQGTKDVVYSVSNAEREIKLFVNSPDARLMTVSNGAHFLSASHPNEVNQALIQFVKKYSA
jgi:pimeloyl-ACP methyl ester carboxylesterase